MSDSLLLSLDLDQPLASSAGHESLRLEVRFYWEINRFRHTISLCDSHGAIIENWCDSVDAGETNWPLSAPIQQLSREEINGQMTLLGVGQPECRTGVFVSNRANAFTYQGFALTLLAALNSRRSG